MNQFSIWFATGLEHIADWEGYDHILFLIALCAAYSHKQWKNILVLVTAFTIGHSLTLALSVLNVVSIDQELVEFLIPVTIVLTCFYNIARRKDQLQSNFRPNYWIALLFGLIHGLGFSTILRSLLGQETFILSPLFAFNIGIETGQLLIVGIVVLFSVALTGFLKIKQSLFNLYVSGAVLIVGLLLVVERLLELIH